MSSAWAANRAISRITMWPALILAANRKERVTGRTEMLVDSIITKKGFSQVGAPPGRSMARNLEGDENAEDRIILSQRVRPKGSVSRRCLVELNT